MSKSKPNRRKFLKYAGGAVAVAAVAAVGYGAFQYYGGAPGIAPGERKVKIGGTKPLTGAMALYGIDELNALTIWAEKWVNEKGGIKAGDGNTYEVELIIYNDESKHENVSRLYEKLITEDKVDFLVGPVNAGLGMATVAAVEKYKKMECYGTASFDPELYRDWKYVVHVCTNGSNYMKNLAEMIMSEVVPKDPDAKNVAVIHGDNMFDKICGGWGKKILEEKGFNIVFYEQYPSPPTDLTPTLTKVKAANPTIILSGEGTPAGTTLTVKQCRELGLNVKLLWPGPAAVYQDFYDAMGKYGEDIIANTQWEPGIKYPVTYGPDHDWFVSTYEKEHPGVSITYVSAMGFTQGLVLQAAMEKSKEPLSSDAVREAVKTVEFTGFYGKFKIDPVKGWQIGHELCAMQWQDGKKECVWPLDVATSKLRYPMKKWEEK